MCILLKWRRKGCGIYLMGKVFASEPELDNLKVYAATRLIHDHTPSRYSEPDSKHIEKEIND